MGWFWGGNKNDKDPTKSLDPALKEFLDSQQPRPYIPAQAPSPPPPPAQPQPTTTPSPPSSKASSKSSSQPDTNTQPSPSHPTAPSESLFPDGRYAHLWSTYTPLDAQTASTTTPLERIVSARKDRRDLLHRAALENCAFEHELQQTCFTSGSAAQRAKARLTLCREETKAFNRCYSLQGKFLQALGYMSRDGSSDDEEEKIQMHADKLYHRMMDYEASVEEARKANRPIPPLSSIFNAAIPAPSLEQLSLPEAVQRKLKTPLAELPPHERELAVRAALQEAKMTHLYTGEMRRYAAEMAEKRKQRQKAMTKYFGEPVGKFVIPDAPPPPTAEARSEGQRSSSREEELERELWRERK